MFLCTRFRNRRTVGNATQFRLGRVHGGGFAHEDISRILKTRHERLQRGKRLLARGAFLRRRLLLTFRFREPRLGRLFQTRLFRRTRLRADETRLRGCQESLASPEEPRFLRKEGAVLRPHLCRKMPREQAHRLDIGFLKRHERSQPRRKVIDGHIIRFAPHGNCLVGLVLRINLVGRARRARRTIPCNPPYLIRLVRPHDPRRKKIVAYKPLQKRKMARVASRRRLQQFVKRTRPQHLRAQFFARLGEAGNIRQVFTTCAYRIKFFAAFLGFALRDLGFCAGLKRRVRAHIDFRRGPDARLCKQLGQIPRIRAI